MKKGKGWLPSFPSTLPPRCPADCPHGLCPTSVSTDRSVQKDTEIGPAFRLLKRKDVHIGQLRATVVHLFVANFTVNYLHLVGLEVLTAEVVICYIFRDMTPWSQQTFRKNILSLWHYAASRKVAGSNRDEVDFLIDLILTAALWPWGWLSL
jgi:hypothetical protein